MDAPDPFADGLPRLDADRLVLRPLAVDDMPALPAIFGDADHLRYWSHGPLQTEAAAREYLSGIRTGWRERAFFQWGVEEVATGEVVGTVTLADWDRDNRRAEIGFIVRPDCTGRGYATEAVRRALVFAFGPMGLHRIEADVDPDNASSLRLLERVGFRREGVLRDRWFTFFGAWKDSVILGLLADEWRP